MRIKGHEIFLIKGCESMKKSIDTTEKNKLTQNRKDEFKIY